LISKTTHTSKEFASNIMGGGVWCGNRQVQHYFTALSRIQKAKRLMLFTLFNAEVIFTPKEAIFPGHFPQHSCELLSEFHVCRLM